MRRGKPARATVTALRGEETLAWSCNITIVRTAGVHLQMYVVQHERYFEVKSAKVDNVHHDYVLKYLKFKKKIKVKSKVYPGH